MTRLVFMGTPEFAVPSLQTLIAYFDVVGVVTAPDRPAGRGNKLKASAVKAAALQAELPIFQPKSLRNEEAVAHLAAWQPDVIVVAAFGQILRPNVLDMPPHGCVNVHASLLPRWRGASPINAAIRAGDTVTGVTLMKMDPGMDTGPIISQRRIPITPNETAATLHDKLAMLGATMLREDLPVYLEGRLRLQPQPKDDSVVTKAPLLKKEDGEIDWAQPAIAIDRQIRAYDPWPGTFTTWAGKNLKVLAAHTLFSIAAPGRPYPGTVIESDLGPAVGTGEGLLLLERIQLAGRKAVDAEDFINGHPDFIGSRLGAAPKSED